MDVNCQAAVERRVALFRSIGATFTSIQELAACVIFVRPPASNASECSFSHQYGGTSLPLGSYPDYMSVPVPSQESPVEQKQEPIVIQSVENAAAAAPAPPVAASVTAKRPSSLLLQQTLTKRRRVLPEAEQTNSSIVAATPETAPEVYFACSWCFCRTIPARIDLFLLLS